MLYILVFAAGVAVGYGYRAVIAAKAPKVAAAIDAQVNKGD